MREFVASARMMVSTPEAGEGAGEASAEGVVDNINIGVSHSFPCKRARAHGLVRILAAVHLVQQEGGQPPLAVALEDLLEVLREPPALGLDHALRELAHRELVFLCRRWRS